VLTTHPVTLSLPLAFSFSTAPTAPIEFPLNGCEITFQTGTDFQSGAPGLLNGEIHGSVKNRDIQGLVIPAIAVQLTQQIQNNPTSAETTMLRNLFDVGDGNGGFCTNPDNTRAYPMDGVIGPCEVAGNNIIANVLAPDVQIYDAAGNYAPSKFNQMRDSLSFAVGFTAVRASY
jgi:hypothetical protein